MFKTSRAARRGWPRLVGGALIVTGVLGLLLSVAGMIFVSTTAATARRALTRELSTLDKALLTTSDALVVARTALSETRTTLSSISLTVTGATQAISQTQPALTTLQALTGEELPATIRDTRQALASAQETARVADSILNALSFLGLEYNPEVPLSEALGTVSESLSPVPGDLAEVSSGVGSASANLDDLITNLVDVADGLDSIAASVEEANEAVAQYDEVVADLRAELLAVQEAAPGWITTVQLVLFLFLIWLGLAQIALLLQGWRLLQQASERE